MKKYISKNNLNYLEKNIPLNFFFTFIKKLGKNIDPGQKKQKNE